MRPLELAVVVMFALASLPAVAGDGSELPSISGDESLNRAMAEYRQPLPDGSDWRNPWLPAASAMADADEPAPSGSGDQVLARSVAHYTRARLDAGGFENPYMRDEHYASGNPILLARPGEGITTAPGERGQAYSVAAGK
jgi:hypothetical protein